MKEKFKNKDWNHLISNEIEYYQIIDKYYLEKNIYNPHLFNMIYNDMSDLYKYDFDLFYFLQHILNQP